MPLRRFTLTLLLTSYVVTFSVLTSVLTVAADNDLSAEPYCRKISEHFQLEVSGICQAWFDSENPSFQSKVKTTKNQPLVAIDVPSKPQYFADQSLTGWLQPIISDQPFKILLINGIHGNEISANWAGMRWTVRIQKQAHLTHWRVLPLVNPDGALQSIPTRTNAAKIDLNRNFLPPSRSLSAALTFWKNDQLSEQYYPGKQPFNQPESRFIRDQIAEFAPHLIISLHSPYGVIDFDGPSHHAPKQLFHLKQGILPTSPGSLGNYAWNLLGIPVLTIEFNERDHLDNPVIEHYVWLDTMRWVFHQYLFKFPRMSYSDGEIFQQAMTQLNNQKFSQARHSLTQISDPKLLGYAKNNLAYIALLDSDKSYAKQLLLEVIDHNNADLRKTAEANLKVITETQVTPNLLLLSQFKLVYLPESIIASLQVQHTLNRKINLLIDSLIVDDRHTFAHLFINEPTMPEFDFDFAIVKDILFHNDDDPTRLVSEVIVQFFHQNQNLEQLLRISWIKQASIKQTPIKQAQIKKTQWKIDSLEIL